MEAFDKPTQSKTNVESETISTKLLREAELALVSVPLAAQDALQNHKIETLGKAAVSAGMTIGMSFLSKSTALPLAAAGIVAGVTDLAANSGKITAAFVDNWQSDRNWQTNTNTVQNTLGRFSVDFAIGSLAGAATNKAIQKFSFKPSAEVIPFPRANFPVIAGSDYQSTIVSEGRLRKFDIHLPKDLDLSKPTDVLLAFDGVQINRDPAIPGLNKLADRHNFIAIVPHADTNIALPGFRVSSWNSPGVGVFTPGKPLFGHNRPYDDTRFVNDILTQVDKRIPVGRIGLAGFSEGAGMAMHLAGILPKEKLLGVASLSGAVLGTEAPMHKGLTTLIVLGGRDKTLPIEGGSNGPTKWLDWLGHRKVTELSKPLSLAPRLAEHHGITNSPVVTESNGVIETVYSAGESSPAKVHQFLIKNGEHSWPGKNEPSAGLNARLMRWVNGNPADFDINERIANLIMNRGIQRNLDAPPTMHARAA